MVAFGELLLTFHWATSALHSYYFTGSITKEGTLFCTFEAYIAVIGANLEICYNFCFIFTIFLKVFYLNGKGLKWFWYHLACLFIIIIFIGNMTYKGSLGLNNYGTCSTSHLSVGSMIAGGMLLILLALFSCFVLYYTNQVLPQHTTELAALKRNFYNFYSTYLKMLVILWSLILVAYVA